VEEEQEEGNVHEGVLDDAEEDSRSMIQDVKKEELRSDHKEDLDDAAARGEDDDGGDDAEEDSSSMIQDC
jgi:hypothetical protein